MSLRFQADADLNPCCRSQSRSGDKRCRDDAGTFCSVHRGARFAGPSVGPLRCIHRRNHRGARDRVAQLDPGRFAQSGVVASLNRGPIVDGGRTIDQDTIPKPGGLGSAESRGCSCSPRVRHLFGVCSGFVRFTIEEGLFLRRSDFQTSSTPCRRNRPARDLGRTAI